MRSKRTPKKSPPVKVTELVKHHNNPFLLPGHRLRHAVLLREEVVGQIGKATIVREQRGKGMFLFELNEEIALEARKKGKPIGEETRRWIEIPDWTPEQERKEIQDFFRPNDDPFFAKRLGCRVELTGSIPAADALATMAMECLRELQTVADLVCEQPLYSAHSSIAAAALSRVISEACGKLNELARKQPRIFHRFTRKYYWKWPVMKSTVPGFGDDDHSLLAGLQLGKDLPLRLDAKAQWARGIDGEVGRIAWNLFWYVWQARSENNRWGFDYGDIANLADVLPPFDKATAPQWWEVAKVALLQSYPNPLKIPEFAAIVKGRKARRYRSRLEEAFFEKLKKRFLSFARPSTSPTQDVRSGKLRNGFFGDHEYRTGKK